MSTSNSTTKPGDSYSTTSRPFLRWAGSKRATIPRLLRMVPPFAGRYFEPFVGSAALFYGLQPRRAVLSDINAELINTYKQLRQDPAKIHARLVRVPRTSDNYYRWRSLDPAELTLQTRAVRFLYLNRLCFNGLYRTNARGEFNVPFSGSRVGRFLTLQELKASAASLRRASIRQADFQEIVSDAREGDFVYLDPPYRHSKVRPFEYDKRAFTSDDLDRVSDCLIDLDRQGAKFLLSYAEGAMIRQAVGGWHRARVSVQRNIAGFARHRRSARELVIANYDLTGRSF